VGGLVSFAFREGTILSRSGKCGVIFDRLRMSYPQLILDGIEHFDDGESQRGEVLLCSEGSELFKDRIENAYFLKVGYPRSCDRHGSESHTASSSSLYRCCV